MRMDEGEQEDKKWHTYFLVDGDWRLSCTSHRAEEASPPPLPTAAGICFFGWRQIRPQPTGRQPSIHGTSYFGPTGEDHRLLRRGLTH